ncbi:complex III assembly factor LYRM7-like isoform X1 [Anneissia japonica]|uniref:complex III assembly factor LYRM7-like isoform X1 n=1 Tax=Anneissia japonica TaxID=1529436 RepID=UPI0014257D08|nr:complex III assembly factor LYRM7-like isoform X1 [Anneissia japonica]
MREKVLATFRALHRTRKLVFKDDERVLNGIFLSPYIQLLPHNFSHSAFVFILPSAARLKINEEFKKNKSIEDTDEISKLVKIGEDAELFLRKKVVQAEHKSDGIAELHLRKDVLLDNAKLLKNNQETGS